MKINNKTYWIQFVKLMGIWLLIASYSNFSRGVGLYYWVFPFLIAMVLYALIPSIEVKKE